MSLGAGHHIQFYENDTRKQLPNDSGAKITEVLNRPTLLEKIPRKKFRKGDAQKTRYHSLHESSNYELNENWFDESIKRKPNRWYQTFWGKSSIALGSLGSIFLVGFGLKTLYTYRSRYQGRDIPDGNL
jgi:hypothetical protein